MTAAPSGARFGRAHDSERHSGWDFVALLGSGTGSELSQPLGYAMVGGLLLSQALTLFTTPVVSTSIG